MKPTIIFDVDGTLADLTHRLHHILEPDGSERPKDKKNWPAFFAAAKDDLPINEIIILAQAIESDRLNPGTPGDFAIVLASGRTAETRKATEDWLAKHKVPYDHLFMRRAGDHRDDHIVKKEYVGTMREMGYRPILAFEDRQRVVDMYRAENITTVVVGERNNF